MAKAPKTASKKGSLKSTTKRPAKRVGKSRTLVKPASLTETGCCCCENSASWVVKTCEDGACVDVPPPNYFGLLAFDPAQSPQQGPFWCRPANFPAAFMTELIDQVISNLSPAQCALLAAAVAGNLANILQVNCDCECDCSLSVSLP